MPGAHRDGDSRFCGAVTVVTRQSTVFVEDKLWAVAGDKNSHEAGFLIPVVGDSVYVEDKLVIVAIGDTATIDDLLHPPALTAPLGFSSTVNAY
jgi:hypothetical protein